MVKLYELNGSPFYGKPTEKYIGDFETEGGVHAYINEKHAPRYTRVTFMDGGSKVIDYGKYSHFYKYVEE